MQKDKNTSTESPLCAGCGKSPEEILEYVAAAKEVGLSPNAYVMREEGTLNRTNYHFWCTSCYVEAGMPLGVAP